LAFQPQGGIIGDLPDFWSELQALTSLQLPICSFLPDVGRIDGLRDLVIETRVGCSSSGPLEVDNLEYFVGRLPQVTSLTIRLPKVNNRDQRHWLDNASEMIVAFRRECSRVQLLNAELKINTVEFSNDD